MINRKKILLTALAVGVLTNVGITSIINSNAASDSLIVWDKDLTPKGRPKKGHFNGSPLMAKNPDFPTIEGAYVGGGGLTYKKSSNQKVITSSKVSYGFTVLFYEPYAKSSGSQYLSRQADGMKENYYSRMGSTLGTGYDNWYYTPSSWTGSKTNFSLRSTRPNYGGKKEYSTKKGKVDERFNKKGQWRYIGYNQKGQVLSNPFFPADGAGTETHRSDQGFFNQDLHNVYNSNKPAKTYIKTIYDGKTYLDEKIEAIERLLEYDTKFKTGTIKQVKKGVVSGDEKASDIQTVKTGDISAKLWANCLSLMSDPNTETPMFQTRRYTSTGIKIAPLIAPTSPDLLNELEVNKIRVTTASGALVGEFKRDSEGTTSQTTGNAKVYAGQTLKISYTMKNTGTDTTTITPAKIQAGIAIGANARKNDYNDKYKYNDYSWVAKSTSDGKLAPGSSVTISSSVVVPASAEGDFRVTGYIHDDYIKKDENGSETNDWGHVKFKIIKGDIGLDSIDLIDIDGKKVDYMKPGEKYKIKYNFKYEGDDVQFKELDKSTNKYNTISENFTFSWTSVRYLPDGSSELFKDNYTEKRTSIKKGTTWQFETPYYIYEVPKASATASLKVPTSVDNSQSNNSGSKDWKFDYDIKVNNVELFNTNERPTQNTTITLGLKYDITLDTPTKFDYFETDVNTSVTLPDGKTVLEFTDHIKQGKNPNITKELQVPVSVISSGSKNLTVKVDVNTKDRNNNNTQFYEVDLNTGQSNNNGSAAVVQLPPINPNTTNGSSNNTNSFNVNHIMSDYKGSFIRYTKFDNSLIYSFYKYGNSSNTIINNTYNETYKINSIKFKSKDTVRRKYGDNGWVDLTKSSEKNKALIKAGYGYELEIEVEYKTDALSKQPNAYALRGDSSSVGKTVTNQNNKANVYKDIYVKTSDGKVLSATGMYNTIPAFDVTTIKSDEHSTILKYTMRVNNKNGVKKPVKIYTSENTKDGNYGLTVWTPTITGVSNPQKSPVSLCDRKSIEYIIKGSMYDDNQDSIVQ